jgi:arylsulfatase A-like enzyme
MIRWCVLIACLALGADVQSAARRPNIVLIMADDMGFSDVGCYGGEVATPNIDRLAANGLRFTQFYNAARCCPTRASLLTGLHPHQAGIHHMVDNRKLPLDKRQLSRSAVTIAEVLGQNGYRTAMAGKWHICPVAAHETNGPAQRGFQNFYGIIHGGSSYYDPVTLMRDDRPVNADGTNYFLTDAIAENAANYVRALSKEPNPFFIYVAFTAPHWPLHAPAEDAARYTNVYARGWDVLRKERHERLLKMGLVDRKTQLTPRDPRVPPWTDVTNKVWQAWRMAVYAAQIERMDRGIGRIIEALQQTGAFNDTLILFLSDNGACAEMLGAKQNALHVPKSAPDGGPMRLGNDPSIDPGPADTYASYGMGWANLGSTPFRLYKHWVHEGGIATPFIVHWPAAIRPAGLRHDPAHLIDVMATCLDVARAKYPSRFNGNDIQPLEGVSLTGVFRGKKLESRPLFWEHEGNRAVRQGRWKLVSRYPQPWELYDIENDRSEMQDLAALNPQKAAALAALYADWAKRANVTDWATLQTTPAEPKEPPPQSDQ